MKVFRRQKPKLFGTGLSLSIHPSTAVGSIWMKQYLARRIHDFDKVKIQAKVWQETRNNKNARINWRFTTDDARIKLKRLYPLCED